MQSFMQVLRKSKELVTKYDEELRSWKEEVAAIKEGKQPHRRPPRAPEKKSLREQLARLKKEAQKQPQRKHQHLKELER